MILPLADQRGTPLFNTSSDLTDPFLGPSDFFKPPSMSLHDWENATKEEKIEYWQTKKEGSFFIRTVSIFYL